MEYPVAMSTILLVTDTASVSDRVHAALAGSDVTVVHHIDPKTASRAAYDNNVDSVLVSMRVGAMGAMAVARAVRAAAGTDDPIPVTILLARKADEALARRSGARNWVDNEFTATELREALDISH